MSKPVQLNQVWVPEGEEHNHLGDFPIGQWLETTCEGRIFVTEVRMTREQQRTTNGTLYRRWEILGYAEVIPCLS